MTTVSSSVVGVKFSHHISPQSVSGGHQLPSLSLHSSDRTLLSNINQRMNQFVNHKTGSHFPVRAITAEVDNCIAISEGRF